MTSSIQSESVRSAIDSLIDSTAYNPSSANQKRAKKFLIQNEVSEENGTNAQGGLGFDIPKTDLMTVLSPNILSELVSGEKNSYCVY